MVLASIDGDFSNSVISSAFTPGIQHFFLDKAVKKSVICFSICVYEVYVYKKNFMYVCLSHDIKYVN